MSITHIPKGVFLLFIISMGLGIVGWALPSQKIPLIQQASKLGNSITTSLTYVSAGFGTTAMSFTVTGHVIVSLQAVLKSNATNSGCGVGIFYNTVGVPAYGASVGTDSALGAIKLTQIANINDPHVATFTIYDKTHLSLNTGYFFYVALIAFTASTQCSLLGIVGGGTGSQLFIVQETLT